MTIRSRRWDIAAAVRAALPSTWSGDGYGRFGGDDDCCGCDDGDGGDGDYCDGRCGGDADDDGYGDVSGGRP